MASHSSLGRHAERARRHAIVCVLGLSLASLPILAAGKALDEQTAASGLKEALEQGTNRAVTTLGTVDGYLKNQDVRIPLPENLTSVARTMRKLGMGQVVDELETSMNRAAEAAAPLAKDVFLDTIKQMTFKEALTIVRGNQHEATDYLAENSRPRLSELFQPIVSGQLDSVGTTRAFGKFMKSAGRLTRTAKPSFDLNEYVTGKALDGLFFVIAREEEKIRKDPLARTTDLLKTVFGGAQGEQKDTLPWWKRRTQPSGMTPPAPDAPGAQTRADDVAFLDEPPPRTYLEDGRWVRPAGGSCFERRREQI